MSCRRTVPDLDCRWVAVSRSDGDKAGESSVDPSLYWLDHYASYEKPNRKGKEFDEVFQCFVFAPT